MHVRQRWHRSVALVALALAIAGCDRKPEVSISARDAGVPLPAPSAPSAAPLASLPRSAPAASSTTNFDEGPDTPPPSGGPWATCADGFRISGNPLRDVTRLGLLCGPATGMRRPEPPLERSVAPNEPWAFDVPVAAGECLRLFVASASAASLSVTTSGAPALAAHVGAGEGWLVSRRRGPLCASDAVRVHVVVSSAAGGNIAVGRWFLPP